MANLTSPPTELHHLIGSYLNPKDLTNYLTTLKSARVNPPAVSDFVTTVTKPVRFLSGQPDIVTAEAFELTVAMELNYHHHDHYHVAIPDFYEASMIRANSQTHFRANWAVAELVNGVLHGKTKFYLCDCGWLKRQGGLYRDEYFDRYCFQVHDCPQARLVGQGHYTNGVKSGQWILTAKVNWFTGNYGIGNIEKFYTYHRESGNYGPTVTNYADNHQAEVESFKRFYCSASGVRTGKWLIEQVVISTNQDDYLETKWYKWADVKFVNGLKEGPAWVELKWLHPMCGAMVKPGESSLWLEYMLQAPPRPGDTRILTTYLFSLKLKGNFRDNYPAGEWKGLKQRHYQFLGPPCPCTPVEPGVKPEDMVRDIEIPIVVEFKRQYTEDGHSGVYDLYTTYDSRAYECECCEECGGERTGSVKKGQTESHGDDKAGGKKKKCSDAAEFTREEVKIEGHDDFLHFVDEFSSWDPESDEIEGDLDGDLDGEFDGYDDEGDDEVEDVEEFYGTATRTEQVVTPVVREANQVESEVNDQDQGDFDEQPLRRPTPIFPGFKNDEYGAAVNLTGELI